MRRSKKMHGNGWLSHNLCSTILCILCTHCAKCAQAWNEALEFTAGMWENCWFYSLLQYNPTQHGDVKWTKNAHVAELKGKNYYKSWKVVIRLFVSVIQSFCIKNLIGDYLYLWYWESATCCMINAESIFDYEYLCEFDAKFAKALDQKIRICLKAMFL